MRAELAELIDDPRVVAIGECGLDFYRDRASHEAQERAFEGQAELALEAGKALVIHSREAAARDARGPARLRRARRAALLRPAGRPGRGAGDAAGGRASPAT